MTQIHADKGEHARPGSLQLRSLSHACGVPWVPTASKGGRHAGRLPKPAWSVALRLAHGQPAQVPDPYPLPRILDSREPRCPNAALSCQSRGARQAGRSSVLEEAGLTPHPSQATPGWHGEAVALTADSRPRQNAPTSRQHLRKPAKICGQEHPSSSVPFRSPSAHVSSPWARFPPAVWLR